MLFDPSGARQVMQQHGIEVSQLVWDAMTQPLSQPGETTVQMLADGRDAAGAAATAARADGCEANVSQEWITGPLASSLEHFIATSRSGLTIAAGEASLAVTGAGLGGRNTHAALLAAREFADCESAFAAYATDGVDANSGSAGAIVDGLTIKRGGDPTQSLVDFDSAGYLASTNDLLPAKPTGTNVADLWMIYRGDKGIALDSSSILTG